MAESIQHAHEWKVNWVYEWLTTSKLLCLTTDEWMLVSSVLEWNAVNGVHYVRSILIRISVLPWGHALRHILLHLALYVGK